MSKKIKVLEVATSILSEEKLDIININSKIEDYNQEDMMELLMTKIKGCSYNSECLNDKFKTL